MVKVMALVLLACAGLSGGYILVPHLWKMGMRKRFLSALRGSGCVFLTFDDGPDPKSTPRIVDILDKYRARGTFFLVGNKALAHPGLVDKIVRSGHGVGSHGFAHIRPWSSGPLATARDFRLGLKALGGRGVLYRPPFGKFNLAGMAYVLAKGLKPVFWDVDPEDYGRSSAGEVASEVLKKVRPGSVVLLHDGRQSGKGSDPEVTVAAVEVIVKTLAGSGVRLDAAIEERL